MASPDMEAAFKRLQYDTEFQNIVFTTIKGTFARGPYNMADIFQCVLDMEEFTVEEKLCLVYGLGHSEMWRYLNRCLNTTIEEKDRLLEIFRERDCTND